MERLHLGRGSNITVSNTLTVTGNSTMLIQSKNTAAGGWHMAGGWGTINAGTVQVDYGSMITADGQGYGTGLGPGGSPAEQL